MRDLRHELSAAQPGLALDQRLLSLLALRDVAHDPLNIVVVEKRDADFSRETGAVPAPDHSLVQARFSLADLCAALRPFPPFSLRVGHLAVKLQKLGSGVAQHLAIAGVHEDEISLLVGDEDAVRGLLDELPKPGFALTQSLFGEPASPPHFGLAQLALQRRQKPREIVLHDVVVRAGLHHVDGDVLADRA